MRIIGIEILRILSILSVITFHISDHGSILVDGTMPITLNWITLAMARIGGGLGNCVFVLISGYLLIYKDFDTRRILKLWIQVLTYSIVIGLIGYVTGVVLFSIKSVVTMVLPIIYDQYWFITSYIILMLLTPFFNPMLISLSKRKFQAFLAIGLIVFSVIPTIIREYWMLSPNSIVPFIFLYAMGAYVRLFDIKSNYQHTLAAVGIIVAIWFSSIAFRYINIAYHRDFDIFHFYWPMIKTPVLLAAIFLFLAIKDLKVRKANWISFFSTSVFGVYLIHIGRLQVWLFKELLDDTYVYGQWYFPLWLIGATLLIFVICTIIDKMRIHTIEKFSLPYINCIGSFLNEYLAKWDIIERK